jgi:hypothetical protein
MLFNHCFGEISIGVQSGDWVEYDFSYSHAPSDRKYPLSVRLEVLNVGTTKAAVCVTYTYNDGTSGIQAGSVDIASGNSPVFVECPGAPIIPANLEVGSIVPSSGLTIEGETTRTYSGITRRVVYTTGVSPGNTYWDKQTGLMLETPVTSLFLYGDYSIKARNLSIHGMSPQLEAEMGLTILDDQKWYTNLDVPFSISEAEDYVLDALICGKPSERNFGNAIMNMMIRNSGNVVAKDVVATAKISGWVVLVKLADYNKLIEDEVFPDLTSFYSFEPYVVTETVGSIDALGQRNVQFAIPVKYMSLVVGELEYVGKDGNNMSVDILVTMVELHVDVKISCSNAKTVQRSTKIFGSGDPAKILEQINLKLQQRIKHLQRKALEELLQRHVLNMGVVVDTKEYSVGLGTHSWDTTIKVPETRTLIVSILHGSTNLGTLVLTIGTITISLHTSIACNFGMIVLDDLEKNFPKSEVIANLRLELTGPNAIGAAFGKSETNTTLTIITVTKAAVPHDEESNQLLILAGLSVVLTILVVMVIIRNRSKKQHQREILDHQKRTMNAN